MLKRATAMAASAALPLAAAVALTPMASAQETVITGTVEVTYTCIAANAANIGGSSTWTNQVEVTYPEAVAPGEFFDVSIQPGSMQPNQTRTGRVNYDIQMPDNADYLTQAITSPASGFNSGTPALVTVNPTTKVNSAGTDVLRIWGGTSARYGTSSGTSTNSGLAKTSTAAFQLPEVTFTMRAPNTPGEEINFGLPGAGAASPTTAETAQFQYTRGTSNTGTQVECAASANAAELTSTTITDDPWVPFEWNTDLNIQAQVGTADEDSQPVNVVTSFQRPANDFPEGTSLRILRDGVEVGEVEIPETGTSVPFADDIPRGAQTQVYRYTAEIIEAADDLGDTWVGESVSSVPVIVSGTGGEPGGSGSLDTGSLDAGSLTDFAQGSLSDSVGYDVAPVSVVLPDLSVTLSSAS